VFYSDCCVPLANAK